MVPAETVCNADLFRAVEKFKISDADYNNAWAAIADSDLNGFSALARLRDIINEKGLERAEQYLRFTLHYLDLRKAPADSEPYIIGYRAMVHKAYTDILTTYFAA